MNNLKHSQTCNGSKTLHNGVRRLQEGEPLSEAAATAAAVANGVVKLLWVVKGTSPLPILDAQRKVGSKAYTCIPNRFLECQKEPTREGRSNSGGYFLDEA